MTILACIFMAGVLLRGGAGLLDTGFGGPVWDAIVMISSISWVAGFLMAFHVLTGFNLTVGVSW